MTINILLFLLQVFLRTSSIFIAIITLYYVFGLVKFIYDAVNFLGKDALKFGIMLFIVFLAISIPANLALFYVIW